jgi:hypothetical protein
MGKKVESNNDEHAALKWALQKITDDPDNFFEWNRTRAQIGDHNAAEELLHGFCLYIDQKKPIPAPVLKHLYLAFSVYLSSRGTKKLEKLLGLKRPAHRKRGTGVDPVPIVAYMRLCIKRDGMTKQAALQASANRFHVTTRTIERYDKDLNQIRTLTGAELEQLAKPTARPPYDKN